MTLHTDKVSNRIHFDNAIMKNRMHIKGKHRLRYDVKVRHKKDDFDILKNKSKYVNLVQLMDSLGNLNRAISILGHCIFDSNY